MKTIFLGDTHGRNYWKEIVEKEKPDKVVFIADYFDSFVIDTETQVNNFLDIIAFKESGLAEVIMLIGNHDIHYYPSIGNTGTSGYQEVGRFMIEPVIEANKHHLQMAYQIDNILCTHAGVNEIFLYKAFFDEWNNDNLVQLLNDLFIYQPYKFNFGYFIPPNEYSDPYGDDPRQSPIWIRPTSLMKFNYKLKKKFIQIAGHTQQNQIDIKGKATGGRYYFIDTLGSSKEYLIYDGDEFITGKII